MGSKFNPFTISSTSAALLSQALWRISPAVAITTPKAIPGTGPASDTKAFFQPGTFQFCPMTAAPNSGMKNMRKLR